MDCLDRYRDIVPDWEAFRAVKSRPLVGSARVNTLKIERDKLLERLAEQGLDCRPFNWHPLELKLNVDSPGKLLENLLGFHSYPGGILYGPAPGAWPQAGREHFGPVRSKTTQISAIMENRGAGHSPLSHPWPGSLVCAPTASCWGHATVLWQVDSSFHACRA